MKPIIWSALGLVVALGSGPLAAAEGPQCGKRQAVIASLEQRFSEHPVAAGLDNGGAIVEVFAAAEGDTWTILVSMPDGLSCVVAAGENWQPRDNKVPAKGKPL